MRQKKETEEFYASVAENATKPIATIEELSNKWEALGDNIKEKEAFIESNAEAFNQLAVSVNTVSEAEHLLVERKNDFIKAQFEKAKATAYLTQAQDKVKEYIKKQQEYEALPDTKTKLVQTSMYTFTSIDVENKDKKKLKGELDDLENEIKELYKQVSSAEEEGLKTLQTAGIKSVNEYSEETLGAIQQAISKKRKALEKVANKDDYDKIVKEIEELQQQAKEITGETTSTKTTSISKNENIKSQEKINEMLLSLRRQNRDDEIDLMEDTIEKKVAKIKEDYDRQKVEIVKKTKELVELNKKDGTQEINENGLTNEQQTEITKAITNAEAKYNNQIKSVEQERLRLEADAMQSYLKQYGTYQQQRLAITEEYSKKIANAHTEGERLILGKQRDKDLKDIDDKIFKENVDWETLFVGLDRVSSSYLDRLKERLLDALSTKGVSLETVDSLIAQLDRVNTAIVRRKEEWKQFFAFYNPEVEKAKLAEKDLIDLENRRVSLQEQIKMLTKEKVEADKKILDLEKQIAEVLKEQNIQVSEEDIKNGNIDSYATQYEENGGDVNVLSGLTSELSEVSVEADEATTGLSSATSQLEVLDSTLSSLGSSLGGGVSSIEATIKLINQNIQSMPDLMSELGLSDTDFGQGWDSFAESSQFALQAFESFKSGDIVGAVSNALGSLRTLGDSINSWGSSIGLDMSGLFGSNYDEDEIERLSAAIDSLTEAVRMLSEDIETGTLEEAKEAYEKSITSLNEAEKDAQKRMADTASAYSNGFLGIGGEKSSNSKINAAMSSSDWKKVSEAAGKSVNSASDFWSLTSEQMANVAKYAAAQYATIKDKADDGHKDAAQYMDSYISMYEELEEVQEAWYQKLTQIDLSSIESTFKDLLLDMEADAEDFVESFEQMMQEAIVGTMMSNTFNAKLEQWYDDFADAMKDGVLSAHEKEDLQDSWEDMMNNAIEMRDALYEALEFNTSRSASQSASTGTFQTMSQETGDELSGRFTALQIAGESINTLMGQTFLEITNIGELLTIGNNMGEETNSLVALGNTYLEDVAHYARLTYEEMYGKLGRLVENTDKL